MFLRHNIFTLFFFSLIIVGCFLPGSSLPKANAQHLDKVFHITLFGCFSFSAFIGFVKQSQYPRLHFDAIRYVIGIAIILTVLTEVVQHFFIPRRTFDFFDILADSLGIGLALLGFMLLKGKERCGF